MGLAVKIDEDLPAQVSDVLQSAGHQAETIVGQGIGGAKDATVWEAVEVERRLLITADKGFGDIRLYPPGTHGGVLLLRPDEDGIDPLVDLLRRVLEGKGLEPLWGTVTVVTPRGVRIRRS